SILNTRYDGRHRLFGIIENLCLSLGGHRSRALTSGSTGNPAEYRTSHKASAARIIKIEKSSDQFTSGMQAGDRLAVRIDHARRCIDLQPAEGEGNTTGHRVSLKWRLIDSIGPVQFIDRQAFGPSSILDVRIEDYVCANGPVVCLDCLKRTLCIHIVKFFHELLERVGANFSNLLDAIFVTQQRNNLFVENLPGELARLHQDRAAVFCIGVITKICTFVHEPLAVCIDHNAPRIRMLLEVVANGEVAEFWCVAVPADRVTAGPVPGWHSANFECHANAIASIETGAAYLGELPTRAKISGAHLRVGLETSSRQHHAFCLDFNGAAIVFHAHAFDTIIVRDKRQSARIVSDSYAILTGDFSVRFDKSGSAAPSFDR